MRLYVCGASRQLKRQIGVAVSVQTWMADAEKQNSWVDISVFYKFFLSIWVLFLN